MRRSYEFNVWADTLDTTIAKAYIIAAEYFGDTPFDIESIDADAQHFVSGDVAVIKASVRARARADL